MRQGHAIFEIDSLFPIGENWEEQDSLNFCIIPMNKIS